LSDKSRQISMKRSISERCLFYVMFSEDKDHIFFSCSNSTYVWEKVMLTTGISKNVVS
jgi:hypothetical protein